MSEPTVAMSHDTATCVSHVTPLPDDPPHDLHGFCWCQPVYEDVPPDGRIYIHRRSIDSPHIETPA